MNVGDRVTTPHGPATIIEVRGDTEWIFHRARPRPLVIVRYPGGNVHAWVPAKVTPIMQITIRGEGNRMTTQPTETEQGDEQPDEEPNPDQTQLPDQPEQQPEEQQPEPDEGDTDDETDEQRGRTGEKGEL